MKNVVFHLVIEVNIIERLFSPLATLSALKNECIAFQCRL